MSDLPEGSNLPAALSKGLFGVPAALVPRSIKALDRFVGAAVDIPVAWLEQKKAEIDARTKSLVSVESSIGQKVAREVSRDEDVLERAKSTLLSKAYRTQKNREAIVQKAIEEVKSDPGPEIASEEPLSDDWLNKFEKYAEDASTERMQDLWARVLAGEIRKPRSFSPRSMRFLSEFLPEDANLFETFCNNTFGEFAPLSLFEKKDDISHLLALEQLGLVQSEGGTGYIIQLTFDNNGKVFIREGIKRIVLFGNPGASFSFKGYKLTTIGQELVHLLKHRDPWACAAKVALNIKQDVIYAAVIGHVTEPSKVIQHKEVLWDESNKL